MDTRVGGVAMEIRITGTPDEIKELLQAITSSKKQELLQIIHDPKSALNELKHSNSERN